MKKKLLSLLLILCLMCSLLPQIVIPASAGIYGPECGENATWALDEETGTLTVSGTGNGNFSPDRDCTRGQIVTFLYRTYN